MSFPIVQFDYDFSPFGQKIRYALTGEGVQFLRNDVSPVLPRPTLEKLGITYRRIPLTAIGKDVYADTSLAVSVLSKTFGKLPATPADKAYETFGVATFKSALSTIPVKALSKEFVKDRETIFPFLARPDYESLRGSGLADVKEQFLIIENEFLATPGGPFIGGDKFSIADVHVCFAVNWILKQLGLAKEKGFSATEFPRIYKYIESLPKWTYSDIDPEKAIETVTQAKYSASDIGVDAEDPTGLSAGTEVKVEQFDTDNDAHPQLGTLVGLNVEQIVIELPNGVRLHFPRGGTIVRKA